MLGSAQAVTLVFTVFGWLLTAALVSKSPRAAPVQPLSFSATTHPNFRRHVLGLQEGDGGAHSSVVLGRGQQVELEEDVAHV